jgi:hypothetical protein
LFGALGGALAVVLAGCSPTAEEQVGAFVRDFVLQTLAAYLF